VARRLVSHEPTIGLAPGLVIEMTDPIRPVRVRLSRTKGWRMPPNTVKVDRTTPFGNPFPIDQGREQSVRAFREWFTSTKRKAARDACACRIAREESCMLVSIGWTVSRRHTARDCERQESRLDSYSGIGMQSHGREAIQLNVSRRSCSASHGRGAFSTNP